jgi:hypothetical protein
MSFINVNMSADLKKKDQLSIVTSNHLKKKNTLNLSE